MYQDFNAVLTAPEIAVNPLTWSLGFPPDEVRDVSPYALLQALSCCPLCSFPQAAGKAAFPGATALTSSLQEAIIVETAERGSSSEESHVPGGRALLLQ